MEGEGSRSRYGRWHGGRDPLAPPYDLRAVLDEVGRDVLAGDSFREALRALMRRGLPDHAGLAALRERLREQRRAARRRGHLGAILDQVRAALDQALAAERESMATDGSPEARLAELELETVPDDVAGAVRALDPYAWRSAEAERIFETVRTMLQREVIDARFAGLRDALTEGDQAAAAAVKDMLSDLNALLAAHARGEDTTDRFAEFMQRHGELFPDQPRDVDDLVDSLARRQAAADRLLASLRPEQREQLAQLLGSAMADPDLASQLAQLDDNLRALRPGLDRGQVQLSGSEQLGYSAAVAAVAELADLEALDRQLAESASGASLDAVDVEALERHLGADAAADLRALRSLQDELERQGYVTGRGDTARLTARALRRLGRTALGHAFAQMQAGRTGDHEDHRTGAADEPTGLTRPWVFGDELPVDAVRTVANAVRRGGVPGRGPVLLVEDFEVVETERRTAAAVALCVDLSYSMYHEGRWGAMKQTALALSHLVATRFRQDALEIVGFSRVARRLTPTQLAEAEPADVQGTNLQHALMLAGRHLGRHPDAEPVVLVVTDGEPTAHLAHDGAPAFRWPPATETVRLTVAQVDELARRGTTLNVFRLGEDPGLARFVDAVARRAGGRVFAPDVTRLGEYVVSDYLRARRGRR